MSAGWREGWVDDGFTNRWRAEWVDSGQMDRQQTVGVCGRMKKEWKTEDRGHGRAGVQADEWVPMHGIGG